MIFVTCARVVFSSFFIDAVLARMLSFYLFPFLPASAAVESSLLYL